MTSKNNKHEYDSDDDESHAPKRQVRRGGWGGGIWSAIQQDGLSPLRPCLQNTHTLEDEDQQAAPAVSDSVRQEAPGSACKGMSARPIPPPPFRHCVPVRPRAVRWVPTPE